MSPEQAAPIGAFTRSDAGWTVTGWAQARAVLADERFEVAGADPAAEPGTVAWLRAAVSRFSNGSVHERRRAQVVIELDRLDPVALRTAANRDAAQAVAAGAATAEIARDVPTATLAAELGLTGPGQVVAEVAAVAAAYFPGADTAACDRADRATAALLDRLRTVDLDVAVARIALLVQGFDATAGLIRAAVDLSLGWGDASTDAVLAEVLRYRPPVRALRRVAAVDVELAGCSVSAADVVVCDVAAANRDRSVFERPDEFDPSVARASLTFGSGIRPCPGSAHALALAAGVIDAIRAQPNWTP